MGLSSLLSQYGLIIIKIIIVIIIIKDQQSIYAWDELFKSKDNIGTRTNKNKTAINKLMLQIRRFVTPRAVTLLNSQPESWRTKIISSC